MGGSKTQTTTQTTKSDPWAPAQPALQEILTGASEAYRANPTAPVYTGQRVAGLGSDTLAGLDALKGAAGTGSMTAGAGNDLLMAGLRNGGATTATDAATAGVRGVNTQVDGSGLASAAARVGDPNGIAARTGAGLASGAFATDASALGGLAQGLAGGGTQTQRSLQDVADGKFLGGANPWLDDMAGRAAGAAASRVGQQFAASGRYGSGRFAGAVADAVAGAETGLRYQDYEAERGRQAQAAAAIDAARNTNASTVAGLYQGLAGINQSNAGLAVTGANLSQGVAQAGLAGQQALAALQGTNADRALAQQQTLLSSAQSDRAAGLAGIAAIPGMQSALAEDGRTLARVGGIQDAARQDQIDADRGLFDDRSNAAWRALGNYAGLAFPAGGLGGTTEGRTVQQIPQPSLAQQLLGFGLAAAGTASRFF